MKHKLCLLVILIFMITGCKSATKSPEDAAANDQVGQEIEIETDDTQKNDVTPDNKVPATNETKPDTQVNSTQQHTQQQQTEKQPEKQKNPETKPSNNNAEQQTVKVPDVSQISCRNTYTWNKVRIVHSNTQIKLQLELPSDWVLKSSDKGKYNILRDGKEIGYITTDTLPEATEDLEFYSRRDELNGITVYGWDNWYKNGDINTFSRTLEYVCDEGENSFTVSFYVNYSELNSNGMNNMLNSAITVMRRNIFKPLSECNGSKKILILGNSFIGTSKVGEFLADMLNNSASEYTVTPISIGMAETETFLQNESICTQLKNGDYCYLFLCGLYGGEENVTALGEIKKICDSSNTGLAIFPAHNESASIISLALDTYPEITYLNWKGEINELIDSGISYDTFCVDDTYHHSKPIAGYVGAHMIYRSLFLKFPPTITSAPLSMAEVKNTLGDYIENAKLNEEFTGTEYII